ncbi:hypothetical protein M422DRAFT_28711 [Sphaerobolus stellatus SS14]|uniref:Uncharacterized protein n=1 Tax=Sphaerobolus stellatus (strain SS14) TaxID=990650 RepID=A0A0C9UW70_SPHS4|nr:hypothetical protein M422DRAFT_28711 [Sphaerobolus stellatus SS14]
MNAFLNLECNLVSTYASGTTPTVAFRFAAAGIILVVSAAASSFPTLAKHAPRIQPPELAFFIGKHFGTGVILSTAFVHLLQEAFESLSNHCLPRKWKDLTGFLVLISFLSIFLIEYISTAYVERMSKTHGHHGHHHEHHHHEHHHHHHEHGEDEHMTIEPFHDEPLTEALLDIEVSGVHSPPAAVIVDERRSSEENRLPRFWRRQSHLEIGHHRHESPTAHCHKVGPRLEQRRQIPVLYIPEEVSDEPNGHAQTHTEHEEHELSRKTRIIGILVLQLGIMIHSVVIGLTLSITAGANFTTLFTAVIFHQLFEGLSLGIRISSLPSGSRGSRLLPAILCLLFAITAPLGLLLGMVVLPSAKSSTSPNGSSDIETNLLTRGLMCALSAGMLIYAAAVEMLAGDFVLNSEMRQLSIRKQALGLISLVLGTVAMGIIGIWS